MNEFELVLCFFRLGQYDETVAYSGSVTEFDAHSVEAFIYLGRFRLNKARLPRALPLPRAREKS